MKKESLQKTKIKSNLMPTYYGREDSECKGEKLGDYIIREHVNDLVQRKTDSYKDDLQAIIKENYKDILRQFRDMKREFNKLLVRMQKIEKLRFKMEGSKTEKSSETMRKYVRQ